MDEDESALNNLIIKYNYDILIELAKSLEDIIKDIKNQINNNNIIQRIKDIIVKMNNLINDNKKNTELIRNDIQALNNNISKQFEDLKNKNISIINNQTKIYDDGKYEGEFKNNKREGKGIFYYNNGDRYEGDYKNDKREGKGILYFNDGDRYEGDFKYASLI
jgi:antitoxin component YwqK of YwqJK toxin-antitoxin module